MKKIEKKNVRDFCETVYKYYNEKRFIRSEDFSGINIVAKFDVIIEVLNTLIKCFDCLKLKGAVVNDCNFDGYDKEFCLCIDSDGEIYIEPIYVEEKNIYLYTGECLTFVHSDCNSKYIVANNEAEMIEFDFNENCDKCKCKQKKSNDITFETERVYYDDMKGFMLSCCKDDSYYTRSFYSTDENLVEKVLKIWTE